MFKSLYEHVYSRRAAGGGGEIPAGCLRTSVCSGGGQVHKSKRSRGTRVKHHHVIERN